MRILSTTLVSLLPCALLCSACMGPDNQPVPGGGSVGLDVAPLEGVDVAKCTYKVELLAEDSPGAGTFSAYLTEALSSDGPAGSWSKVLPCHADHSTADALGSRLNLARVTVDTCYDLAGTKLEANLPLTQSRLFECVDERDTRLPFTFFLELELDRGFADIVAQIFGFELSFKSDCQDAFVPFEDEQGYLRHMPALVAALAWRNPANLALPMELYSYHHYETDAALPAGVAVQTFDGTEDDGVTHYSDVTAPAPIGANSTLDRYAVFGPAGADLARIDHGLPVLGWHVAADKEATACEVTAKSGVSTCQLVVADDQGQTGVLALVPTKQRVGETLVEGIQLIGGTPSADGNSAPAKKYFARDADGNPISISALSCCVDSCCTGEAN